jgi:transcriptional regulator with XRE-family HTH domain
MLSKDVLVSFGERVRALRKHKGWTQEDLAAEVNLDRTYVSGIERGRRNVSLRNLARLAKVFGVSLAVLMQGVER